MISVMGRSQLENHDGDDDRQHPITEGFQTTFAHRCLPVFGVRLPPQHNPRRARVRMKSAPSLPRPPQGSCCSYAEDGRRRLNAFASGERKFLWMDQCQAFVLDFHCVRRSAISSPRFRSSRPSRMLMSSGSARQ
jgi:hypothetical protein